MMERDEDDIKNVKSRKDDGKSDEGEESERRKREREMEM